MYLIMDRNMFKRWMSENMGGHSRKQVADFLSVSYSTVCKWCSGERNISVPMENYIKIKGKKR